MTSVLILTAGFGEGHNTAARALRESLDAECDVKVEVADLYANATPRLNEVVKAAYLISINRFPRLWRVAFVGLDRLPLLEAMLWSTGAMQDSFVEKIHEVKPDVIVSTYPLYAYLYRRLKRTKLGLRAPIITVITDSTGINSAWYRCLSDAFVLADEHTAETLREDGVDPERLHVFGFPVSPRFAALRPLGSDSKPPWKVLFMPSTRRELTLRQVRALLDVPSLELTILAGRHVKIFDAVNEAGLADGVRCRLVGWTDQMPSLLGSHHMFIGKAGGAIVQECMAARCPIVISHVVYGQEEGNIALIDRGEFGTLAGPSPEQLANVVAGAFANDAAQWREWKRNVERISVADASSRIAQFIIEFALRYGGPPRTGH